VILQDFAVKLMSKQGRHSFSKKFNDKIFQFVVCFIENHWSMGFIVGTGQGRLTNGFISLYKPIHAASFFPLPYVTLRNSPQLTGNLV